MSRPLEGSDSRDEATSQEPLETRIEAREDFEETSDNASRSRKPNTLGSPPHRKWHRRGTKRETRNNDGLRKRTTEGREIKMRHWGLTSAGS